MRVLGICYGSGHVNALLPVLRALEDRGDDVSCLALTTAKKIVEAAGIKCFGYSSLLTNLEPAHVSEITKYGLQAVKLRLDAHPNIAVDESIAYLGWNLYELAKATSARRAWDVYARMGRAAFDPREPLELMVRLERPDLIIATNAPRSEKNSLLVAKDFGIPSICLVDLFPFLQDWISKGEIDSEVCVVNDSISSLLRESGLVSERIHVTGNPDFSEVARGVLAKKAAKSERVTKTILYVSQREELVHKLRGYIDESKSGHPDLLFSTIEQIMSFIETDSREWRFVVRAHPNVPLNALSDKLKRFTSAGVILQDPCQIPVESSLADADIVVSHTSTLGVISSICGIPSVKVFGSIYDEDVPTEALGVYAAVTNVSGLGVALDSVVNADYGDSEEKFFSPMDSVQRVIKVIDYATRQKI